ncbi:MAG: multidrug ABC transporter ATP-binding protein [Actinobacteria bacterium]|nr:multidrug ABC transporter ATP-binding protein [Actinomycetota bacterium]
MIRAEQLSRSFAARRAVHQLNFELKSGSVVAFVGPNGAGKTTTLRMITGALAPSSGRVLVDEFDTFEQPYLAREKIGFLPEIPPLYPELKVIENLRFVCAIKGLDDQAIDAVIERCELAEVLGQLQHQLSKGFRQRVGLALALLGDPPLLILDEPTSGLDPAQIEGMRELIKTLGEDHTVLLSTHLLSEVEAVCDHVLMIDRGELVADAAADDLIGEYGDLQQAFLARCAVHRQERS